MESIALTGFMGCGKTSVGKQLAKRLAYSFIDTDACIEHKQKLSVCDIFRIYGEEYFREAETELLKTMKNESVHSVISVGGGLPLRDKNRQLLHEIGFVIYLKATEETIYNRIGQDTTRPLLAGADAAERIHLLMAQRSPIYERNADITVVTDNKTPDEICEEIICAIGSARRPV